MRTLVTVLFTMCALSALGCEDKKPEGPAKPGASSAPAAAPGGGHTAAPAKTGAPGGW